MSFAKLKKAFVMLMVTSLLVGCIFVPGVIAAEDEDTDEEIVSETETETEEADDEEEDEEEAAAPAAEAAAPAAPAAPVVAAPVVTAAPVVAPEFDFEIRGGADELQIYVGDRVVYTIDMPQMAIEFATLDSGSLVMYVANNDGLRKAVDLGNPSKIALSGPMAKVNIGPNMDNNVAFTVKSNANIYLLTLHTANTVNVEGKITTIAATGAGSIVVKDSATISIVELHTKEASLSVEKGASVSNAYSVNGVKTIDGYKNIDFITKLVVNETRNQDLLRNRK